MGTDSRSYDISWLDQSAAGWGWFVDPTPGDDSEFTTPGDQGEQNRMDLLTALAHEIGHLLGQKHAADGLMAETLTAGTGLMRDGSPAGDEAFASHPLLEVWAFDFPLPKRTT